MKIKILILALFCCNFLFSQDQLFKKDNSKLDVKILEITPTEIKFKLTSNIDGPLYIISKADVALIIYKNGEHEAFKDVAVAPPQTVYITPNVMSMDSMRSKMTQRKIKQFDAMTKNKNVVFLNALELLNAGIGLSYLREFFNGLVDVHVPVSFSFATPTTLNLFSNSYNTYGVANYKLTQKVFDIGLGIYVNTSGKRAVTHFVGPLVRFAQFNGTYQTYELVAGYPYNTTNYNNHGFVLNQTYVMLNNGILFRISPNFNMMINAALGFISNSYYVANNPATYANPNNYYYSSNYNSPVFQAGMSFGYRF